MSPISLVLAVYVALITPAVVAVQFLAPVQDINFPASESASNPLEWLGANSPWFTGPNVYGISSDVPENCYVDQAAYVTRHGSRYPDPGAYSGWVGMQTRFQAGNYTVRGSLSFLPEWRTVLTNPSLQMSMESPTGYKEAHDLGYALRTRYPQLYNEGDKFIAWANNYTRVLQTAQMFVRGFLGPFASTYGSVASVTSTGFPGAIGDSLSPSDGCPSFYDSSGGNLSTEWASVFVPPIQERLQALIEGNLTLTANDITQMPYLCGFESQITGTLSPWCGVFTDEELRQYEYSNDLRYYYGMGPGTGLESTMMMPFLNALVGGLLQEGPATNGTDSNGGPFALPKLLMSFLNDGQLVELVTASGVFDGEPPLSGTEMDDGRLFIASRFVSMRGTVAFERLNCLVEGSGSTPPHSSGNSSDSTASSGSATAASSTASTSGVSHGTSTKSGGPSATGQSSGAGNGTGESTTTVTRRTKTACGQPSFTTPPQLPRRDTTNATFVRILLNDVVYPLPSCKSGPGSSCQLSDYVAYVQNKYAAQGNWARNCNVTTPGAPTTVQGASFFTDLTSPWVVEIQP